LNKPVTAPRFDIRFPIDAMLGQKAKESAPACVVDTDKPSWAHTVVGAAFGIYDVAQVCHNHYHRLATLPGGWGMIGPLAPGERDLKEKDELFHRTNTQYYHFLNCGIRLGVSGGSAMGVMPVPLGYSRTYAQVRGEFTPDSFWHAVREGRTFATSGPILTFEVNGQGMGASLALAAAELRPLRISAHVQSLETIHSVELIENGQVIHREAPSAPANGKPLDKVFEWKVQLKRSGWFAARALFLAPDGGLRQAHTSPIYAKIDGKPIAFRPSAEYMLRWLDRLVEIAEAPGRFREAADKQAMLNTYHQAREFYVRVIANAKTAWGE
jgi:hypothetical protein